jgi:hypothetical protein
LLRCKVSNLTAFGGYWSFFFFLLLCFAGHFLGLFLHRFAVLFYFRLWRNKGAFFTAVSRIYLDF